MFGHSYFADAYYGEDYFGVGAEPIPLTDLFLDLFNGNPADTGYSVLQVITGSATRSDVTASLVLSDYYAAVLNPDIVSVASASSNTTNISWAALFSAASGGYMVTSARLGAHYTIAKGNPVRFLPLQLKFDPVATPPIDAPVLTLDTPTTDNQPELTASFDSTVHAGDTLVLQYGTDSTFSGAASIEHQLDSDDIDNGFYTFTVAPPLGNGTWYFRCRDTRRNQSILSNWSNTITEIIFVPPTSFVPDYYWLGFP